MAKYVINAIAIAFCTLTLHAATPTTWTKDDCIDVFNKAINPDNFSLESKKFPAQRIAALGLVNANKFKCPERRRLHTFEKLVQTAYFQEKMIHESEVLGKIFQRHSPEIIYWAMLYYFYDKQNPHIADFIRNRYGDRYDDNPSSFFRGKILVQSDSKNQTKEERQKIIHYFESFVNWHNKHGNRSIYQQ
ncbi:MAG: hypothetical protein Q8K36_06105, partial [Alphaproteobacteria bacterium]|nr:hypothetical protein [Alphaproteobacteria bacterium]